jgi:uncharacterized protein
MALFVFQGLDKPNGLELRKATRQAHLDWIAGLNPIVKIGGPMLAEDGQTPVGSLLVIEAETLTAAQNVLSQDPYAVAGLWRSTSLRPFNWLIRQ